MTLNFDNTEVAFRSKSRKQLKKAYLLFKMVEKPWMVKFGKVMTNLAFFLRLPVKGMIKSTIFEQFCGGEDIADCNSTIEQLKEYRIGTILDYSVEGKESEEDLDRTVEEVIATIHRAKEDNGIPFSVFKPTGVTTLEVLEKANEGEDKLSPEEVKIYQRALARVDRICGEAAKLKVPLFIDAEDSWFQGAIDRMAENMMAKYNQDEVIVYTTLQFYRWDRIDYLKELHQKAKAGNFKIGIKLVRGAYMEKERERAAERGYRDPIQPDKASTDKDYNLALEYCIENLNDISICAGTHNEKSSKYLAELLQSKGIDFADKRVFFAQLLGMSDHISYNLSDAGYNVAKYVPYGPVKEVLPYLIRRAEENTSVAGQTGRELSLIMKERKRRSS